VIMGRMEPEDLNGIENPAKKRLYFSSLLSREVESRGGRPVVVVGGEALEAYTEGGYSTGDIDIVSDKDVTEDVLRDWGFRKKGRIWYSSDYDIYVDWRSGTVAGELEPEVVELDGGLEVRLIALEDLVLDRLRGTKFWDDKDGLMWAKVLLRVKAALGQRVDSEYIIKKAEIDDVLDVAKEALMSLEEADEG